MKNDEKNIKKDKNRYRVYKPEKLLPKSIVKNPLNVSVSEAAKIGGVTSKTIRRAIQDKLLDYNVDNNRYQIDFRSLIIYLNSTRKLKNKLNENGIGQYIREWKD